MKDWTKILEEEINKSNINHIDFLNKYEDLIEGPNRDAKLKKVKRLIAKLKNNTLTKEKVYENLSQENIVNLNICNKSITFGLISDTHFSSKYVQITYLNKFYDYCKSLGITNIYHAGDIDDGENMRPGHSYENYRQGADEHIKEIIKNYPMREGITTHFITGNHDASFRKLCGLDIGEQIQHKRKDMNYLGRDVSTIFITPNISMMLRHPWSGSAYALSYRPQKIIEAMESSYITKPTILGIGHFHKMEYLFYHGVHCFQTGCFQSPTPFTDGKGISVSMGGWVVTLEIDKDTETLLSITPKAITFTDMIKEDYKNYL